MTLRLRRTFYVAAGVIVVFLALLQLFRSREDGKHVLSVTGDLGALPSPGSSWIGGYVTESTETSNGESERDIKNGTVGTESAQPRSMSTLLSSTHALTETTAQSTEIHVPPVESHQFSDRNSTLQWDMERCSRAMGIPDEILREQEATLMKVSVKASMFLQALWNFIPKNFLDAYKSPCWKAHNPDNLKCLPYFMVAGFPKSGTSTLHSGITKHPDICKWWNKEPHWWTRHNPGDRGVVPRDYYSAVQAYLKFLEPQNRIVSTHPNSVTWDNSQSTLWDSPLFMDTQDYCALPVVVSRLLPDLKFIIQMREPVSRIYSHYIYSCSSTLGSDPSKWPEAVRLRTADTFHGLIVSDIKEFTECLQKSSLYECTNHMTSKFKAIRWTDTCSFITHQTFVGLYYVHIAKWLQFYPRENFLFLRIDDMSDPYNLMSKITNFLGISPVSKDNAEHWFAKKAHEQVAFGSDSRKHQMREDTRELLENLYRPYNKMLAELLGDDRFLFED